MNKSSSEPLAPTAITQLITGKTCSEERTNSCEIDNLCEHDAPCNGTIEDYECVCPEGLEGKYCEDNINDCAGNPCQVIL